MAVSPARKVQGSPEALARMLERLRKGHLWLTERALALDGMEHLGIGSPQAAEFLEWLDRWDTMDLMLRDLYGFTGCVANELFGCPDASPVRCRGCVLT